MHYFVSYFNISVLLGTIVKKKSRNNLRFSVLNGLSVIHQPGRMVRKASDVSAAVWQYQNVKNYCKLTQSCTVTAFPGVENCCKNLQFIS